ncbi:MAG: hypothetical protein A3B99_04685 [Candidatus Yanofskybacteria bacterium RIFCSPHIGHO2_02_FULL_44_12b]|uniref:HMA domain-containing protein n=2 Tax=Candidatus Yanofskyibacteriota TaxID=1752733 RepID=A0A1F8GK95_9BACT|nr:MAG: Cu2+-exporting ATPase [Candidatus Yanofskybacteria bacterium GW2011_GWA2_44_9]OGN04363.1 MAG: hypothetical protein A2659_03485 [Candidatus Yanofskybacteria bacterium RIFCSPHIGHO2_01_FULL_44_24]OGN14472.1 MAG: hypothetical protein A3B99_04685 [Candidatus Yanofskybacteria bacterium RIFCSPHIGHO2_02_FULL_44_12b]OGN25753.1 MAG: hypothetical protein A2925_01025 [Candidatus Yanofskybacteria bacterium RIFCSPLOWO2_01_FULL_44_22]
MKTTTLTIRGTHCKACKTVIEDLSKDIKGVKSCQVDFKTGTAIIEHENDADLDAFKRAVEDLGQYKLSTNS